MADFKSLLGEFAQGNASIETVRSWIDDAIEEGKATPASLTQELQAISGSLPAAQLEEVRQHIQAASAEKPGDSPLEFDFSLEDVTASDDDKTVADPAMSRESWDGELSLEEAEPDAADKTVIAQPADADKTQMLPPDADKTQMMPQNPDKTQIAAPDTGKTQIVGDADATVVTRGDATVVSGGEMDPFAMADSTQPGGGSSPTGTGWPTNTNFSGRAASLDPKTIGPGTILKDRFELLSAIGEGGMGMVYKARDLLKVEAKDRNPYIAVKLLSGDFREHPEAFIALQRESSKAQKLAHPNITTVYDFDRDGPTVYLTMELMEGEELAKYIKKLPPGGLPVDEALDVVRQLCDGLQYAHARGLVHSDFKPGNCFFLKDGTVKILDFGIARASTTRSDAAGETTVFDPGQLGALTPAYATPEMFEGMDPAPSDDIYALAAVAYELLTGKHPFNKLSSVKAMEKGLAPAPITNKPGFTKRQQKALFKALAFKREDRTQTVEEFWDGIQYKKDRRPMFAGIGLVGALIVGAALYKPVVEYMEDSQNAEIVASLEQGATSVPDVLDSLDQFSERAQRKLLEEAKDVIIGYYEQQAESKVDANQNRYDFAGALRIMEQAKQFYPDSAQLSTIVNNLQQRRNDLINQLTSSFDNFLAQESKELLLPIDGEDDITDVLAKLRQVDPNNTLLNDARLTQRYAELAEAAIKEKDWTQAQELLTAGLEYASGDASLLNLNDQVSRELKRQADAKMVAEIKARLNEKRGSLNTVNDYAGIVADVVHLEELRPEDPLLKELLPALRKSVNDYMGQAIATQSWQAAENALLTFARAFTVSELLTKRDELSRAEVTGGYQPQQLTEILKSLETRRRSLEQLLTNATFDADWDKQVMQNLKETIAYMRPGNTWFEDMRMKIVTAYIEQARQLAEANRFDGARRMLASGESFNPGLARFEEERSLLASGEAEFEREQQERVRLSRIAAYKNSLTAQTNANDVTNAVRTFETLKQELPADDEFITKTGPQAIAQAYLRLSQARGGRDEFSSAVSFAREGLKYAPNLQELKDAVAQYSNLAEREELMDLASKATPSNIGELPDRISRVQGLFPADATAITNEATRNLANRIKSLESTDLFMANDLLAEAKKLFSGNRAIDGVSIKPPPRPSKYVPQGREALNRNQLTEASNILATAQREEPGNVQVAGFAKELAERKDQANQYFLAYQNLLRQGQKTQAKAYLDQALRLWVDSEQYKKELDTNYTTTRAPTRAADGSRPCTAALAGYGRQGRAVCYDMLSSSERGPELVVVPAGGSFATAFAIGKYEISAGEFNFYCKTSGACSAVAGDANQPVTGISFQAMRAYAQWLSETTGKNYRVPSDAEWLYAANSSNPKAVTDFNCRVTQGGQILKGLTMLEVKSGRPNPWGLTNYVGNVQELVSDGSGVAARGGAFQDNLSTCDIQLKRSHTGGADELSGFRVARDID